MRVLVIAGAGQLAAAEIARLMDAGEVGVRELEAWPDVPLLAPMTVPRAVMVKRKPWAQNQKHRPADLYGRGRR